MDATAKNTAGFPTRKLFDTGEGAFSVQTRQRTNDGDDNPGAAHEDDTIGRNCTRHAGQAQCNDGAIISRDRNMSVKRAEPAHREVDHLFINRKVCRSGDYAPVKAPKPLFVTNQQHILSR